MAGLCLAAAAHRLGGEPVPHAPILLCALIGLFLLGLGVTGKELSGRQIGVLVVATQALLHIGFMACTMLTAASSSAGESVRMSWAQMLFCTYGGSAPSAAQVASAVRGLDLSTWQARNGAVPVAHANGPVTGLAVGMLAMHLLAAVGMAWWLRRGERLVWTAVRRVADCLRLLFIDRVIVPMPIPRFVSGANTIIRRRQVWGSGLAGRGPPAAGACAFFYA